MNKNSISVILPVYNEQDNIRRVVISVVNFISGIFDKFEIIIVDDGSTDRTSSVIENISEDTSNVRVIRHSKNIGYGAALTSGFKISQYPLLFFMDSDEQFNISEISRLLPYTDHFDIVAGVRSVRSDPRHRVLMGKIYNFLICLLFKIRIEDITCGFKLFKKTIFDKIELKSKGGFLNAEMLIKAERQGFSIKEIEIEHFPRKTGKQTGGSLKSFVLKISDVFRLWGTFYRSALERGGE